MKVIISILVALLFLSACTNEVKPEQKVKVINGCASSNISISDIKGLKKSDGFMKAQVKGYNSSSSYELLEYRIIWLDGDGFKIDSILSKWISVPSYAEQTFYINAISPSTKAKTFRIYIRKEKEVICNQQSDGL
ncbi:MAG: hypothetical protein COB17_09140 [Sulfurimonas sp.]|nr:MAG: hypothetical protein COB17_09140 [Sulfurimonas sp.]